VADQGDDESDEVAEILGLPVCYPDNAILTLAQVAVGLQISVRSAERIRFPVLHVGKRTRRYLWRAVIAFLEAQSK
jgi:hypothetical protein